MIINDLYNNKKQGMAEGSQEINWIKPNFDFEWHEVEEQSRMKQVPVDVRRYYQKHFPNKDAWLKAVQNGKAVVVPPDHNYEIRNAPFDKASLQKVLAPTGHEGPIGPAKEKRVNDLFDKGQVEMPIILKTSQGLWLIGGKTRLGTANYVKGLPAKVWLIDDKQGVAEDKSNDTAISLSKLGKFHPGADTLAQFVPERATAQYALHPDKWESTFYSLTNKDSDKLKYYGPKKISIPPGTLVGDMAIANKFYRAKTTAEKQQYAEAYKASLQPYPVDVSEYRMPELLIPKQGVAEEEVKEVTKQSAIKQYQDIQNYKDKPSPKQDDKEFIKVSINRPKKTNTNESFDYIDEE